jgi:hypothetical protein
LNISGKITPQLTKGLWNLEICGITSFCGLCRPMTAVSFSPLPVVPGPLLPVIFVWHLLYPLEAVPAAFPLAFEIVLF